MRRAATSLSRSPRISPSRSGTTATTDGRVTTGLLSGGEIFRLNDPKLSIERAAGFQPGDLTLLATEGTPSHVQAYGVTEGFFELFGLPMTIGGFKHDDFTPFQPPAPTHSVPRWS